MPPLIWTNIFWTNKYLLDRPVWTNIFWKVKCLLDGLVWTDIFWTDKYLLDRLVWTNIFWTDNYLLDVLVLTNIFWTSLFGQISLDRPISFGQACLDKYLLDGLVWTNIFWRNSFGEIYFRGTYLDKFYLDGIVWTYFGWIFSLASTACVTLVQFGQTVDYQKSSENSLKTIIRINNGLFSTLTLIAEGNIWDAGNPEPTSCNAFVRLPASKTSKIEEKKYKCAQFFCHI